MKNLLDDHIQYRLPKYEIILVWIGVFLNFFFYGMLNISYYFALPNSMISGGLRLTVLAIGLLLILIDILRRDMPPITISIFALFIFAVYYLIVFWMCFPNQYEFQIKIKMFYDIFIANMSTLVIFICGRERFKYIISKPMLLFLPAFLDVLIILLVHRNALATMSFQSTYIETGIARTSIKYPMQYLIAVAPFLMFFSKNLIFKFILGPLGCFLALLNLFMGDSRSTFFAFIPILIFYAIVSLRSPFSFSYAATTYGLSTVLIAPYLAMSTAWTRFINILDYKERINEGSVDFSRYDLWIEGLEQFHQSPIFGGELFLKSYGLGYCHFTPIAILYSMGIIGGTLAVAIFAGAIRGLAYIFRKYKYPAYWILCLFIADLTFMFFDGNTKDIFCSAIGLLLSANAIRAQESRI